MNRYRRTTVRLSERLLAEAKKYAAQSGKTFTAVLEDALREKLARRYGKAQSKRVRLKTVKADGLRRDVDLDDSAALLDLMDS